MRPGNRTSVNTMNLEKMLALEQEDLPIRPGIMGPPSAAPHHLHPEAPQHHYIHHHSHHHHGHAPVSSHTPHDYLPDLVRGGRSRGSVGSSIRDGSDTSSAYSGSDTMCHSVHSLEQEDVDLSGLKESIVDSDEEDLAESIGVSL